MPMTLGVAVYLSWVAGFLGIITSTLLFGSACQTNNTDEEEEFLNQVF